MGLESSEVFRFDVGHLLQDQIRTDNLKMLITCLLFINEVCNVKPTCRISWVGNRLMSDLTFDPFFKVK